MFSLLQISATAWQDGLEPALRTVQPGVHSGFLLAIALMLMLVVFNYRHLCRVLRGCGEELASGRHGRNNVFDEHPAGDVRVMLLLIVLSVFSSGVLLGGYLSDGALEVGATAMVIGVMALWYIYMYTAYSVVGYTFTDSENSQEWLRNFNASQAIAGSVLLVPALVSIFNPTASQGAFWVGFILFIVLRMAFIFKGFRIFYKKIGSLVYFILYLCTLEIIPLIFVYQGSFNLVFN